MRLDCQLVWEVSVGLRQRGSLRGLSWSETPRLSVGLRVQVRRRVAGDDPRTDQNNDGKEVKRAEVPPAKLSWLPGWLSFCLVVRLCVFALRPGVGCWVAVSGALASSLVVGCCPCLPGSGFCAGFREKGRPLSGIPWYVGSTGASISWAYSYAGTCGGLFPLLTSSSISEKRLHALSTHRRGPVEEPPRAERALRGGSNFRFPAYCFVVQLLFAVLGIPAILSVLSRTRLLFEISWSHYKATLHFLALLLSASCASLLILFDLTTTWNQKLSSGLISGELQSAITVAVSLRLFLIVRGRWSSL